MAEVSSEGVSPTVMGARSEMTSVPNRPGVNNLGYRGWSSQLAPAWMRWSVITELGARRAWQSRWLRRMLMFAWFPAFWFGFIFFAWEQAARNGGEWGALVTWLLTSLPRTPELQRVAEAVRNQTMEVSRHAVWGWLLYSFFRYSQGVLMVLVVGLIAPPLISQDIRSRAFLLYFSRPLTRWEYLMGKLATLWGYLMMISTVPSLTLYVIGVMLSPKFDVVLSTWDLPLRIFGASVVLILPASVVALSLSSLTQESRYAAFAWFAIWVLGWFTYIAATTAEAINVAQSTAEQRHQRIGRGFSPGEESWELRESTWTHLSPYHTLGRVQRWVFGFSKFEDVIFSMLILVGVTLISLRILYVRISAPMRV